MKIITFTLLLSLSVAGTSTGADDIVETASSNKSFSTLVAAVKAAGLVETLQGDGPFTVFAPTNEAFSKLPEQTLQNLLKPESKPQLTAILTYHVVPDHVPAKQVIGKSGPRSLRLRAEMRPRVARVRSLAP